MVSSRQRKKLKTGGYDSGKSQSKNELRTAVDHLHWKYVTQIEFSDFSDGAAHRKLLRVQTKCKKLNETPSKGTNHR